MSSASEEDRIVAALSADARRDIYQAAHPPFEFWITYRGGGPFHKDTVDRMFKEGKLVRRYPTSECYTLPTFLKEKAK